MKEKSILNHRTARERIIFALVLVLMIVYALSLITPFLWVFMSSLKDSLEYSSGNAFALPEKWLFSNYADAMDLLTLDDGTSFLGMIFNSVWYTAVATGLSVFMSSVTGYCMAKYTFKARNVIYAIAIFCMTIPIVGNMASYYKLIYELNIYDTPVYVVVTHLGAWGFNFLVMYATFKNISWSYAEAVFIDGGNHFTVFFKIMLPQAAGPIATLCIMSAIGSWNDYMPMILYLPSYPTLASGLYTYQSNAIRGVNFPVYFAGVIISLIPVIVIFACFSDLMMKNMSVGGLKG